jgi:sugar lactone lactonase YvrE
LTASYRIVARDRVDQLGEGPYWSVSEGALYWVDILDRRVNRLSLSTGRVDCFMVPERIGWLIERAGGGFIAGLKSGFAELDLDPFVVRPIASPEPDRLENRMNDAKADPFGNIYAGTMPDDDAKGEGSLYRLAPDRGISVVDSGYGIANGPAICPDGRTLFHADSARRTVYRIVLGAGGMIVSRDIFLRFQVADGRPDGMTIDSQNGLWIAHWGAGRVSRFLMDGTLDRTVKLPASQITSLTFGGSGLDRLFVTSAAAGVNEPTAGVLFELDVGVSGLPPCKFAG